jgi:hypothetical protein
MISPERIISQAKSFATGNCIVALHKTILVAPGF